MRVKSPRLCDPRVKQYSGYLDTEDDKHFFFWFFESRRNPSESPLVMWLNGGPGCSSSTGLLMELGPCKVSDGGHDVTYNEFGWNEYANMIFLDQPVNVGYSYSSKNVTDSPSAAEDVYVFMQLFLKAYPEYANAPFSIAAESYGGVYAPNIASTIHRKNKALADGKQLAQGLAHRIRHINLSTVLLGNAMSEPRTQLGLVGLNACNGPYPIYKNPNGPECRQLEAKSAGCGRRVQECYDIGTIEVWYVSQSFILIQFLTWRVPSGKALNWCDENVFSAPEKLGINPFDTRIKCPNAPLCYAEMEWLTTWLNNQTVKAELGVPSALDFSSCNWDLNKAMTDSGEGARNAAALLPELLADGIRVLAYGGNADFLVPPVGYLEWMSKLDSVFQDEFVFAPILPWSVEKNGTTVGVVKAAGGKTSSAGNFTFVSVYEAGHMMPYNQPAAALRMFKRWLENKSLAGWRDDEEL
ncbi:hypothetical protein FRB90_010979 [Tulasnella sp. 427]|nr:hypothetical protein FRB90_010979 [Tulasnella sp. 427]